jgi:hypothetical protein
MATATEPMLCRNGKVLLICTEAHPDGLMVADYNRADDGQWIDYYRGQGVLLDGRSFTISASCDHKGWHHSISIQGSEADMLLNPKDRFGRPGS